MCIVCKEWKAGKLTTKEALAALGELMSASPKKETKHYSKVYEDIMEKEVPMPESDEELNQNWHDETHEHD